MARLRVSPKDAPLRRSVIGRPAGAKVRGQFLSLSWPNTITQSCTTCKAQQAASLNTRDLCGRSTRAASYVSSVASTAVAPGSPAGPANTLALSRDRESGNQTEHKRNSYSGDRPLTQPPSPDLVPTFLLRCPCSKRNCKGSLPTSPRQSWALNAVSSIPPPGPSSAPALIPHPSLPPASALPFDTPTAPNNPGESSVHHLFPWILIETVNAVYKDLLQPSDLNKLCNASAAMPVGEKVTLSVGAYELALTLPTPTPLAKTFLKAIPDLVAFCQAWSVYTALCAAASPDHTLGPALAGFLVHVTELDQHFEWTFIADYILTVCEKRFGHADADTWSRHDMEAFQDKLAIAPTKPPKATAIATEPKKSGTSTTVCLRWNNNSCGGNCGRSQVFVALLLDALDVTWTAIRLWPTDDRRYWTAGVRHHLQLGTGLQVLRNTAYSLTSDSDTTHTYEMLLQSPAIAMIHN
ncbi:uncharacterized protein UDID_19393 [Ustilago sp. UG-2017a]|nr:uncharacterized protein UDID_19393 [Ustilago sp. UG-2017a]